MNISLVEFDVGLEWSRYQFTRLGTEVVWVNYAPGVYVTSFNGDFSGIETDYFDGDYTDWIDNAASSAEIGGAITRIGSVFANNIRLPDAGGLPALLALKEAGFFFDDGDEFLYVRLPGNRCPDLFKIIAGQSVLISNKAWVDAEGGRTYDPDLLSLPSITKTIDPLFFGRIQYNDANITLQNLHGEYDLFADFDVYGQEVRILYGDVDTVYSRFTRMWTGYIDDFTLRESEIEIRASDSRKLLEKPIPISFFSATDYANLNDRDEGKPIPIAYGKVVGANPMCVDKDLDRTVPADYTFVLADVSNHDGIASIEDVRYKGDVVTPFSTNLTTATIVLEDTDLEDANGRVDYRDIEVDFTGVEVGGTAIQNGLDVIKDLIETYGSIPFSNVRYNQVAWNAATVGQPNVGLYVEKDSTIAQQIERIAASLRVQFDVQGDGRFTVREFDPDAETRMTVREDERFSPVEAQYTSDEFASRLYVNYVGGVLRYTTDEATIIDRYKTTKPAEFDTVLTSSTDATEFAEDIMSLAKDFPPLIPVTTTLDETIDLNIEDNVYAILNRIGTRWFGRMLCRVEGIQYDFDSERVTLQLRAFESVDDEGVIVYSQGFGLTMIGMGGAFGMTQYPEVTDTDTGTLTPTVEYEFITLVDEDGLILEDGYGFEIVSREEV